MMRKLTGRGVVTSGEIEAEVWYYLQDRGSGGTVAYEGRLATECDAIATLMSNAGTGTLHMHDGFECDITFASVLISGMVRVKVSSRIRRPGSFPLLKADGFKSSGGQA